MNTAPLHGYEEWYQVRSHEIDHHKFITVPSLLMLMQEASMQNAFELKISVWHLEDKKISWVLLRKQITIQRLPKLGERIKVVTYPAGFDRIFAYRDFWVYGDQEELLAYAASTWTLLNLETRRLQKIPEEMWELAPKDPSKRLPLPDTKISLPEQFSEAYSYQIRRFDLDWNHHVNNVVLSKLMLQSTPEDYYNTRKLKQFNFHIKNECYLDESIHIEIEKVDESFYHRIVGHDGRLVAMAQSIWE